MHEDVEKPKNSSNSFSFVVVATSHALIHQPNHAASIPSLQLDGAVCQKWYLLKPYMYKKIVRIIMKTVKNILIINSTLKALTTTTWLFVSRHRGQFLGLFLNMHQQWQFSMSQHASMTMLWPCFCTRGRDDMILFIGFCPRLDSKQMTCGFR